MGGVSGVLFSLVSSSTMQLVQGWHYGSRGEKLSQLAYELDFQGLRLDVLSTIREEVRDQVFVIMSSLDNLMVVATLMLSIGFGFVVEGTFPPTKAEELGNWEIKSIYVSIDPLAVYSFLCAMSLCMPFWCLIFTIRMRYEAEIIIRGHMAELRRQLCNVLQKKHIQQPQSPASNAPMADSPSSNAQLDVERQVSHPLIAKDLHIDMRHLGRNILGFCPRRIRSVVSSASCPPRREGSNFNLPALSKKVQALNNVPKHLGQAVDKIASHLGPFSIDNEPLAIEQAQILKWAEMDLMHRMSTYRFYLKLSHFLLWLGMLCAIFTCTILLGVYMMENFPNTPQMWRAYAYPVGVNGALGVLYACWMFSSGTGRFPSGQTALPGLNCNTNSQNSLDTIARGSTGRLQGYTEPLLRRSSTLFGEAISLTPQPSREPELQTIELRIREAFTGSQSYRRVVLTVACRRPSVDSVTAGNQSSCVPPRLRFREVEKAICFKFGGGKKSNEGPQRIELLVREIDKLEICDDEDAAELRSGDKLQVTFFDSGFSRLCSDGSDAAATRAQASDSFVGLDLHSNGVGGRERADSS